MCRETKDAALLNVPRILFLVRYGEINRPRDYCHWKDSLLLIVPERKGHLTSRGSHGEATGPVRRQKKQEENVGKSLYFEFLRKEQAHSCGF